MRDLGAFLFHQERWMSLSVPKTFVLQNPPVIPNVRISVKGPWLFPSFMKCLSGLIRKPRSDRGIVLFVPFMFENLTPLTLSVDRGWEHPVFRAGRVAQLKLIIGRWRDESRCLETESNGCSTVMFFFDVYLFSKNEGTEKIRPYTPITGQWDWYIHTFLLCFNLHTFNSFFCGFHVGKNNIQW